MSSPIGYEEIKQVSLLTQARARPLRYDQWVLTGDRDTTVVDPPPSAPGDGIDVTDAIRGWIGARLSPGTLTRRMWLKIHAGDAGETYGVRFLANVPAVFEVTFTGSADIPTITAGLVSAMNLDASFLAIGGVASQPAGTTDIVLMTFSGSGFDSDEQFYGEFIIGAGSVTGTSFQSLIPEASRVSWQMWGLTQGEGEWAQTDIRGGGQFPLPLQQACFAGFDRVKVQILEADGVVLPVVGVGVVDPDKTAVVDISDNELDQRETQLLTILPNDYAGKGDNGQDRGTAVSGPAAARSTRIVNQSGVSVGASEVTVMPPRWNRKGFFIRARTTNPDIVRLRWTQANAEVAAPTTTDMPLQPGEILTIAGDLCPGNRMTAVSDSGSNGLNVWEFA